MSAAVKTNKSSFTKTAGENGKWNPSTDCCRRLDDVVVECDKKLIIAPGYAVLFLFLWSEKV